MNCNIELDKTVADLVDAMTKYGELAKDGNMDSLTPLDALLLLEEMGNVKQTMEILNNHLRRLVVIETLGRNIP